MDQDHLRNKLEFERGNIMNIYTRTGDKGQTSLFDGVRVSKDDIRVEAYGTVDELGSYIGLCKNFFKGEDAYDELFRIQNKLFKVAATLATEDQSKVPHKVSEEDIKKLEDLVDKYLGRELGSFIVPGTNERAAHLHVARTICRRAERRAISLSGVADVDPIIIKYINRLSDTLYAIARHSEDEEISVDYSENV